MAGRNLNEQKAMPLDELVWAHINQVLTEHDGNISAAARALGMHRRTLQRKLQRHGRDVQAPTRQKA